MTSTDRQDVSSTHAGFPLFREWNQREFDGSPWAMRIFDHETLRYLAVNDAALKLYGYTRAEFLALTAADTRHPDEHARLLSSLEESTGLMRYRGSRRHVKKSGEVIEVEVVTQDVIYDGRPARLALTIDVTDRIHMQELLYKRQQEFESLAENLPDLIARFDRNHRFVYVNSAVEKLTGRDRSDMIGKSQSDLGMPCDLVELFRCSLAEAMDTGEAHLLEFRYPARDGERLFEAHHVPERDATGQITSVLCIARDITERKRTEHELRASEERFRLLAENIRQVFWIGTPAGDTVHYISPAYEEIWGRSCGSLYRDPPSWMDSIHPEDLSAAQSRYEAIGRGHRTDVEYRIVRPDGTTRWIRDRTYPMSPDRGPKLVCGIAEDITAQKRAEQERLEQVIRQRDALVQEVRHRVKNKLQGLVSLMRRKMGQRGELAAILKSAVSQLQSVATIYGMQSRSLYGAGIDLSEVLEAICDAVEEGTDAHVALRCNGCEAWAYRISDAEAVPVALALNELIFNGHKHSAPGKRKGTVEVGLHKIAEGIEIRITNRGRLPKGFESWNTGGLALVRTLLAPTGANLTFSEHGGIVETALRLSAPLLVSPAPGAREKRHRKRGEKVS